MLAYIVIFNKDKYVYCLLNDCVIKVEFYRCKLLVNVSDKQAISLG